MRNKVRMNSGMIKLGQGPSVLGKSYLLSKVSACTKFPGKIVSFVPSPASKQFQETLSFTSPVREEN